MRDDVAELFDALESVGNEHEELYDTDVREQLASTLNWHFVWGNLADKTPLRYGMFSAEADKAVADAVDRFLKAALANAEAEGVAKGQQRHDLLQDQSIKTETGGQSYDCFIGHSDTPPEGSPPAPDRLEVIAKGGGCSLALLVLLAAASSAFLLLSNLP